MPVKRGGLMTLALSVAQDQARAQRALWTGVASVIAGVFVLLGLSYVVGGINVAASSRPYTLLLLAPGGMRFWGAAMLASGVMVAYGLLAPLYGRPLLRWWLRRALLNTFGFSLFLVAEFVGSGILTGSWSAAGVVWWLASAVLSLLLVKLPPPVSARRSDTDSGGSGRAQQRAPGLRSAVGGRPA